MNNPKPHREEYAQVKVVLSPRHSCDTQITVDGKMLIVKDFQIRPATDMMDGLELVLVLGFEAFSLDVLLKQTEEAQ